MRNAILLVALFLGGITTQAIAQRHIDGTYNKGDKHRYYNSDKIRFVENGVLFTLRTDGTFSFSEAYGSKPGHYRNGRNGYSYKTRNRSRRGHRSLNVKTDFYGNVVGVNDVCITYKRNGKVRQIGGVTLFYKRGYLTQVGGMRLKYNRFGNIRDTYGYINRRNRDIWHNDWYSSNDHNDYWDDEWTVVENWDGSATDNRNTRRSRIRTQSK